MTYHAGFARLHAGEGSQRRNRAMFFGLDRTWLVAGHKLMFRSDVTEIQDAGQWLGSVGFTFKFTEALGMELWESKATEVGKAYATFKLGHSFKRWR